MLIDSWYVVPAPSAIDRYLLHAECSVANCCCRLMGQMGGRTPDHHMDPDPHTMLAASIKLDRSCIALYLLASH